MDDHSERMCLRAEMERLLGRIANLEQWAAGGEDPGSAGGATALNPAAWVPERFWGRIVADLGNGLYQAVRIVATGKNTFADDPDDPAVLTAANVAERNGYVGMYQVGDIVAIVFDGLDDANEPIYHMG